MKHYITKTISIFTLLLIIFLGDLHSQPYNPNSGIGGMNCQTPTLVSQDKNLVTPGGRYKPESTVEGKYPNTTSETVFRILIVFVQYANDYTYPDCSHWPPYQGPNYINNLLAEIKNNNYSNEWWNAYNETTETISDYFMESSRGNFHVIGKCVNIILPHDSSFYQRSENKVEQLNSDLYNELLNQQIQWQDFDNWKFDYNANPQTFSYQPDNKIDMIYVVHRIWRNNIFPPNMLGSIAQLYNSKQGQSHNLGNGYYIQSGTWVEGSGCTFTTGQGANVPYGPFTKEHFLTVQAHELGHYLFGLGHQNYGIMMGNWYTGYLATGIDARLSPWETIYLGYGSPNVVNFNQQPYPVNYHLNDFSSRYDNTLMQVLQIPINNNPDEFFLIANRTKISTYDRMMAGDTAKDDFFRNINPEYGKGIYIYHKSGGYSWPETDPIRLIDQECADGLFDWELEEFFNPDWSNNQPLAFFRKTGISRINDQSTGSIYNADEKSVFLSYQNAYYNCWGGIGKKHTCLDPNESCNESTDRIYTNNEEIWTSRAWKGDRWDAWGKGYNEIFSPYSCPSTIPWSGGYADIFIWIYNQDNNGVDIKIYKTEYGGYNLTSILEETPPSKPVGLKTNYIFVNSTTCHPKITWEHNIEPDMLRGDGTKRYKIYRALSDNMNLLPINYYLKAVININANSTAEYIDEQIIGVGSIWEGDGEYEPYPLRYKVVAVDMFEDESVPSDFTSATGLKPTGSSIDPGNNDNIINNKIPQEFELSQNYPNPFNPVTKINYALPKQGFVSLKIYDIAGREVKTLVNEFKQAGYYTVDFNGSNLASGVYFYRIQSGNFVSIKKMVLIK